MEFSNSNERNGKWMEDDVYNMAIKANERKKHMKGTKRKWTGSENWTWMGMQGNHWNQKKMKGKKMNKQKLDALKIGSYVIWITNCHPFLHHFGRSAHFVKEIAIRRYYQRWNGIWMKLNEDVCFLSTIFPSPTSRRKSLPLDKPVILRREISLVSWSW